METQCWKLYNVLSCTYNYSTHTYTCTFCRAHTTLLTNGAQRTAQISRYAKTLQWINHLKSDVGVINRMMTLKKLKEANNKTNFVDCDTFYWQYFFITKCGQINFCSVERYIPTLHNEKNTENSILVSWWSFLSSPASFYFPQYFI